MTLDNYSRRIALILTNNMSTIVIMTTVFDVITELFAYVIMGQKNAAITEPPWTLNDVPR